MTSSLINNSEVKLLKIEFFAVILILLMPWTSTPLLACITSPLLVISIVLLSKVSSLEFAEL